MQGTIKTLPAKPVLARPKQVAAYARVSSDKDAMLHSLAAQISYYQELIQSRSDWQFVGVFVDEGITGTKEERPGFVKLMEACREGRIELVLCKSISRLARNTVTLLETVRELKDLGVDVFFEEQNIHTMSGEGELLLTILASYAQEESRSASENQKWRIRRNFENGMPWNCTMLGYRYDKGVFRVVPEEAEIVKQIFSLYLSGRGINWIAHELNRQGLTTRLGNAWGKNTVRKLLKNYAYTGNLLLQTTFRKDHLSKKELVNNGELPMYRVEEAHEPIIPLEMFDAAQAELRRRTEEFGHRKPKGVYPFTRKITCGICRKKYKHKTTHGGPIWLCQTFDKDGKAFCPSKAIPEPTLMAIAEDYGGADKISHITAKENNTLVLMLDDGTEVTRVWKDRSRAESWTPEMRRAASEKARKRSR